MQTRLQVAVVSVEEFKAKAAFDDLLLHSCEREHA